MSKEDGGFRRWAEPDENGVIRRTMIRPPGSKMEAPWVCIPKEQQTAVAAKSALFRIRGKMIEERRRARLSMSIPTFESDGQDCCAIMVIPEVPEPGDEKLRIEIQINGQKTKIRPLEPLELRSEEEGVFEVILTDARFFCERSRLVATAMRRTEDVE